MNIRVLHTIDNDIKTAWFTNASEDNSSTSSSSSSSTSKSKTFVDAHFGIGITILSRK